MNKWPVDSQEALMRFFGHPGSEVEKQLVDVVPPFPMKYGDQRIGRIRFHAKAADALRAALNDVWTYYGKDYSVIDRLELEHYDGAYNPRFVRGSTTKWSNHAFGAAIDIDALHNQMGSGHGHMPIPVVAAFKGQQFSWGGDYHGRTDPMHFEACDRGGPYLDFHGWLTKFGCPPTFNPNYHPLIAMAPAKTVVV